MIERIRFREMEFLLIDSGAIATEDDYVHGRISYAQMKDDGKIFRFGTEIGTREDIEILESDVVLDHAPDAFSNMAGWDPTPFSELLGRLERLIEDG